MAITVKLSSVDVKIIAKVLDAVSKANMEQVPAILHVKAHFGDSNMARIAAAMETALAADADKGRVRRI